MRLYCLPLCIVAFVATSAFAGVYVSAPTNNATVATSVQYVATATTSCSKGVSTMGIYTAPGKLVYTVSGAKLNHSITLNGNTTYYTTVQEWDGCGGSSVAKVTVHVG